MAASLPYLASPNSIKTALEKIRLAATPDRLTGDFISTKIQMKGGTGAAIIPFLKRIGFVAPDGTPTDIYKRFRNHLTAPAAVAEAIKIGYKDLAQANEYFFDLNDKDLMALILQVTGVAGDSQVAKLTVYTLKNLKAFADFEASSSQVETQARETEKSSPDSFPQMQMKPISGSSLGLNLSYTINLNLPATSDQAVFNAIFRSLKEHLLSGNE